MIAYREGHRVVFLYGFAKNDFENISANQLNALRTIGAGWLNASAGKIQQALDEGELQEVPHEQDTESHGR